MYKYKKCSELKTDAREALSGNYATFTLMMFLLWLITFALEMIPGMFITVPTTMMVMHDGNPGSALPEIVLLVINAFITIIVGISRAGISLYCMKICCGGYGNVYDLFYAFKGNLKKSLLLSLVVVGSQTFAMLPSNILQSIYSYSGNPVHLFAACTAFLIGVLVYVPVELIFCMSFYIMVDFPGYTAKEVLLTSIRITRGHRLKLLYTDLSFLPVILLAILSCGIGFIWATPYVNTTYAQFYLDLMNPQKAE